MKYWISLAFICVFTVSVFNGRRAAGMNVKSADSIQMLLEQRSRPTVNEFVSAMDAKYGINAWPSINPFYNGVSLSPQNAAIIIASMERAFPGATYLGLGRDVALLTDLLDGFYQSIGQPNRVRRLDASGPSFPHYYNATTESSQNDRELLFDFLRSNGLSFEKMNDDYPFVVFDVTSWRSTSQSRQLIRAAYQSYSLQGGDLKKLYDRVNFVGISMSGGTESNVIKPSLNIEQLKESERSHITTEGPVHPFYLPKVTSSLTYTTGWHEMFGPFHRTADGRVSTTPGADVPSAHETILGEMFDVMKIVRDPTFIDLVKKAALELGYEFPLKRTESLTFIPKDQVPAPDLFKERRTLFSFFSDDWGEVPHWRNKDETSSSSKDYSTDSMAIYMQVAKKRISKSLYPPMTALDLFKDLLGMAERGTATEYNFKRLIGIFRGEKFKGQSLLNNRDFFKNLLRAAEPSPLGRRYLFNSLNSGERKVFEKMSAQLELNCDDLLSGYDD